MGTTLGGTTTDLGIIDVWRVATITSTTTASSTVPTALSIDTVMEIFARVGVCIMGARITVRGAGMFRESCLGYHPRMDMGVAAVDTGLSRRIT